jgi:hypothetical protein
MQRKIVLSAHELRRCSEFSQLMGELNQAHEFNNRFTNRRKTEQIARDHLIGKVAEVAVHNFLCSLNLTPDAVDFTVIGKEARDSDDLKVADRTISVKATEKGRFLLVHEGQLRWSLSDFYFLCQSFLGKAESSTFVVLLGYVSKTDLVSVRAYEDWIRSGTPLSAEICGSRSSFVRHGNPLPGPKVIMQASNLFVPPEKLRTDWQTLVLALRH